MAASAAGGSVRPLRREDAPALAALWTVLHPDDGACAGARPLEAELAAEPALGVEADGELVGAALVRTWGRIACVHALAVRPDRRGLGLGRRLVEELVERLRRADLAVVGAELPGEDAAVATLLGRAGFRPQPPAWVLERPVAATAPPASGGVDGGEGDAPDSPARPGGLQLLGPEAAGTDLADVSALAASLDAELDPVSWLRDALAAEAVEAAWAEDGGAFAVLPRRPGSALTAGLVLADESAPFPALGRLVAGLDALAASRGQDRVVLPGPTRCWDAVEALLGHGFRPVASRPRFTLRGHPDRADLRRVALASWR